MPKAIKGLNNFWGWFKVYSNDDLDRKAKIVNGIKAIKYIKPNCVTYEIPAPKAKI